MSVNVVTVVEVQTVIAVAAHQPTVTVTAPGPQGIAGPAGPPGGSVHTHTQSTPAATWPINHNLGRYPHVTVVDPIGNRRLSDLVYSGINSVSVIHSEPLAGAAYLS